ncbi:MAG TPA: thiamine phosphate synthase [bacterium]|nr:thiamine phosphate synthase [bacterium]
MRTRADWRVYVITDGERARGRSHLEIATAAVRGGATAVQLRMKCEPVRVMVETARRVASICRDAGVTLIVNDRVDVAAAAGADGAHVGQDDLPAAAARALLGPGRWLGVSAATRGEAEEAERAGADYLGVGAVYATTTKADAGAPVGLGRIREIRGASSLPVVGIGGITIENAAAVIRAGASGVAVVTAVTLADDMIEATRKLREQVDAALAG